MVLLKFYPMEEFPQEEQAQDQITSENIKEFLTSKVIKKRTAAYSNINDFPELINLVQKETLAVALEPALSCLLNFKGELTNNEISNLYLQFTQTKPIVKTLLSELIDKVFENDQIGVIKGLAANISHKNTKVVLGCVSKIRFIIENHLSFFNSKDGKDLIVDVICPQLETVFLSVDKDVKTEGSALSLAIYRIIFDLTLKFLENVKPIILKDLKELFSTVEIPNREIKIADQPFDSSNWKERLAALNFLKESISNMSNKNETYSILYRKTKDPNINVVTAAIECIKRGKISYCDCIKGALDRFKDKKAPLSSLIKETIQLIMPDINILIDSLDIKNPEIKIGVLECLKFYSKIPRARDIGKLLEDSSADVRRLASEVLEQVENIEELTETQLSKLKRKIPIGMPVSKPDIDIPKPSVTQKSINIPKAVANPSIRLASATNSPPKFNKPVSAPSNVQIQNVEIYDPSSFEFNLDQATKSKINDEFLESFAFLYEKEWAKKLESIQCSVEAIRKKGPLSIVMYLISSKETNFHIFKAFLSILEGFSDLSPARTQLISFLNSKITETKLKDGILALYRKLDSNFVIQNFIYCLRMNKSGKKFLTFLEFFTLILQQKNCLIDQFLNEFKVIGVQEKKSLIAFIDFYHKLTYESPVVSIPKEQPDQYEECSSYRDNKHSELLSGSRSDITSKSDFLTSQKSDILVKNEASPVQPPRDQNMGAFKIFKTQINPSRLKNCEIDPKEVFSNEFLQLFESDINKAVMMLVKQDLAALSDLVISLHCFYSIPSPYFNSLILHFISRRYILQEKEAIFLVKFLIDHSMESELELMDRIYPATKLYKIFRSFSGEQSLNAIFSLICKYKDLKDLKSSEIDRCVVENEDFIGFSVEIEKIVKMKEDLMKKYETSSNIQNVEHFKAFAEEPLDRDIEQANSTLKVDAAARKSLSDQKNQEALLCLNSNDDQTDINDLEDSIIVDAFSTVEFNVPNPAHIQASVIIAPSVSDSYTSSLNIKIENVELATEVQCREYDLLEDSNSSFNIPDTLVDAHDSFHMDIEQSLENISISTTPQKKKRNFNQVESMLEKIVSASIFESKLGLEEILKIISNDPQSLIFSCNTIISSLMNQLMNRYEDLEYRGLALNVLLKFTQNNDFCGSIRYETLVSANTSLIPIVKDNILIADVLINLCLNCDLQILRVYFDLLNNTDEILMKLIWRHSKRVNYSSSESTAVIVRIIDSFYQSKAEFLYKAENIVLKVCLLHLKECVSAFSDNIKEFGIGTITNSIVNLLITSKDLNLEDIRSVFKN